MSFYTINPATEEPIREYAYESLSSASAKADKCASAQRDWSLSSFGARAKVLNRAAELLVARKDELARLMALEMGKPLAQGAACAEKCASVSRYYAENAEEILRDEHIRTEYKKSYVAHRPIGTIFGIMPWNFPFWQVFRFAAPALMAGNSCLLKHSPNTFACGEAIESILLDAGLPEGLFGNLQIDTGAALELIGHPKVAAVTLTGSARAGRAVAARAGAELKKCVLELGGSDPYIVLESADLDQATAICATSRMVNAGQSCIGAKRIYVHKGSADRFAALLAEKIGIFTMGDPTIEGINLGPLARKDLRDNLHRQVSESIAAGAVAVCGAQLPERKGWFYPATVLLVHDAASAKQRCPAVSEELFGPVPVVIAYSDLAEAVRLANSTSFGLGGAVIGCAEQAEEIARDGIVAGACAVNDFVRSDARLPFGGTKESGFGRELAAHGVKEFVNAKTICVA